MKKNIFLSVSFALLFASNIFSQKTEGIEFGEINDNKKIKTITISEKELKNGFLININGIPDAATKVNLKLFDANSSPIAEEKIENQNASQKTFKISANNFMSIQANDISLQLNINTSPIGKLKLIIKKIASGTPSKSTNPYADAFKKSVGLDIKAGKKIYNEKLNQIREKKTIHIYLDDDGTFYKSSIPTTAREDNIYVFHVFYKSGDTPPSLEYEGVFDPRFEVEGASQTTNAKVNAAGEESTVEIIEKTFGAIGPLTGTFKVKITGSNKVLIDKTVNVAKLHHISLNAGFYASFNRNPQNLDIYVKPNGDSTLTADDPKSRGFINVMLSFYPFPRNLYFPSGNLWEKFAFNIGTTISKDLGNNFFGGISFDVSRGLALACGIHYGRASYLVDDPKFKFGEDRFSGTLDARVKQRWHSGLYLGVTFDMRLLSFLFNQNGNSATPLP
jgi:hypothetical protein